MTAPLRIVIPIRIESEMNRREHWAARKKRFDAQRHATWWAWRQETDRPARDASPTPPVEVTLTRIGPRTLDGDNLQGGFKAVRDEVARILGIDDGDPRITWRYGQEKGKPKEYAARIEIQGGPCRIRIEHCDCSSEDREIAALREGLTDLRAMLYGLVASRSDMHARIDEALSEAALSPASGNAP